MRCSSNLPIRSTMLIGILHLDLAILALWGKSTPSRSQHSDQSTCLMVSGLIFNLVRIGDR